MQPPAFPTHWDYRRVCEILVAAYATAVGALLMVVPQTLGAPHYAGFGGPQGAWAVGLVMLAAATMHSWSLWLNGAKPWCSRLVRKIACTFHMGAHVYFAVEFTREGIYWGTTTMLLVLVMIYLAMHRAFDPYSRGGGAHGRHQSG